MNFTVLRFDTLESTNTEAAHQARQGSDEGLCIVAREQTAGRGRHGRTWASAPGKGLYFSLLLRPTIEAKNLSLITLMAGVAVYDTLKAMHLSPDIKWVNDVLVNEKKICGILAETVETNRGLAVVLGIGINIGAGALPDEIAMTSTSIERETPLAGPRAIDPLDVETKLTGFLNYWYETLKGPGGGTEIIEAWRQRSSYFSGKPVRVSLHGGVVEGITDGLEQNGALRVRMNDGSVTIVQAGDVERLRSGENSTP